MHDKRKYKVCLYVTRSATIFGENLTEDSYTTYTFFMDPLQTQYISSWF